MTQFKPTLLHTLKNAGAQGITYGVKDKALARIIPEIERLKNQGYDIRRELLHAHKTTPFGNRIKFVLTEGVQQL